MHKKGNRATSAKLEVPFNAPNPDQLKIASAYLVF